jgi:uncharacterized protein (UPF0332 family)
VAALSSEELLEQAERLSASTTSGRPTQADLKRAISAAYYAVFHFILASLADEIVGSTKRNQARYALVYRSIDHRGLRDLCEKIVKPRFPEKYLAYLPKGGLGPNIIDFAGAALELQEKRHSADYDPSFGVTTLDASTAIALARRAIERFGKASAVRKKAFLTLLVFPPR